MRLRVACTQSRTAHDAAAGTSRRHGSGLRGASIVSASAGLLLLLSSSLGFANDLSRTDLPPANSEPASRPTTEPDPARFRTEAGDRVFFAESSNELGARARVALEAQAVWLIRHPTLLLIVEGHADDPGDERANLRLSQSRADAVRERLLKLGVSPERVMSVGFGRAHPAVVCREPSCAAHNRRVVSQVREPYSAESSPTADEPAARLRTVPRRLF